MIDHNRQDYIKECKADFKEILKDNKVLIHYILDKPPVFDEFEWELNRRLADEEISEELFDELISSYRKVHPRKTGKRVGVLVAARPEGSDKPLMGWSLCNIEKDTFNKYIGLTKALDRLQHGNPMLDEETYFIPNTVEYELEYFAERVEKYFKTAKTDTAVGTTTNTAVPPTTNTGGSA